MLAEKRISSTCRMGVQGQITVFMSLVLAVLISLILAVLDGVRIQCMYMNQKQAVMIACENLLAQYCIPLYERYDLFGIDGNGRDLTNALETFISENSGSGLFSGEMTDAVISQLYPLVVDSNRLLEKEVINYMKTAGFTDLVTEQMKAWITSDTTEVEQKKSTLIQELQITQNQAEQEINAASQVAEKEDKENGAQSSIDSADTGDKPAFAQKDPRKSVNQLMKAGILTLVMPQGTTVSDRSVNIDLQTDGKAGALTDFTDIKSVTQGMSEVSFLSESKKQTPIEKCTFLLYVQQHFKSVVNQDLNQSQQKSQSTSSTNHLKNGRSQNDTVNRNVTCLAYEQEALLCGHMSDADNLLDTVNRMILFRMIFNLSYLMMSPTKSGEAHSVAAALTSAVALPMLEQLVYMLIMLAWSYAEAVVDIKALLAGGKIELVKTDASWQLSMENLMNISESTLETKQKTSDKGLGYEAYIFILMTISNQTKIENRMISLMQENIRLDSGYEHFNMNDCYYGLTCIAAFSCHGFLGHFEHQTQWSECY